MDALHSAQLLLMIYLSLSHISSAFFNTIIFLAGCSLKISDPFIDAGFDFNVGAR